MIDLGLEGARAVVFGAGDAGRGGLGPATALRLAEAGARVACVGRTAERATETARLIEAAGGTAEVFTADVTDEDQVNAAIDAVSERFGGVDVCVDIIGGSYFSSLIGTTRAVWDLALAQNLSQVFFVFKAAAARMIEQGTGGSLVALSSIDGMHASPMHAAYGAAKSGLNNMVQSMADEWGKYAIRANTVAPGNVGGRDMDLGPDGFGENQWNPLAPPRAADVANAVLFLSSSLGERITGQTLVVDGGALGKCRWGFSMDDEDAVRRGEYMSAP